MTAEDLPLDTGVETFAQGDAVVSLDVRAIGKHLYLTTKQARALASRLIVNAMRAEELNRVPGVAETEAYD